MQPEKKLFLLLVILVPLVLLALFVMRYAPSGEVGPGEFQPEPVNDAAREYV